MESVAEVGKQVVRDVVQTSGRPTSNGPGRIRTGDMLNGVNTRVENETEDSVTVSVGWDLEDFARPYPLYQEEGFTHVPDMSWIPGMHALQAARDEMRREARAGMSDILKGGGGGAGRKMPKKLPKRDARGRFTK